MDQIREMDPGIGNRRDLQFSGFSAWVIAFIERGDHDRDAFTLDQVDEPVGDGPRRVERTGLGERGERVDDHAARLMLMHQGLDLEHQIFRAYRFGAPRIYAQQTGCDVPAQVDADRGQIAQYRLRALIEAHEQGALAAQAGGLGEFTGEGGLAGARHTGDERAAAAKQTTAQLRVEPLEAGRDALGRGRVMDFGRLRCGDLHAIGPEGYRVFAGHEIGAAIFLDLQSVQRYTVLEAPAELDHAVGHELQEALVDIRGEAIDGLGGEYGVQAVVGEPGANAIHLTHLRRRVLQQIQ